ncbi:MAG: tetratricopeptide repeat protein [Planctomycetes bacterium]|nr:tetratricopeptide repeat protein [Planctomycetota bacterium]
MLTPEIIDLARAARKTGLLARLGDKDSAGLGAIGALRCDGPEAAAFLQGQLTNEVSALQPGEGNLSARVTQKGNLAFVFSLHVLPLTGAGIVMLVERAQIPALKEDLDKFLFAEDAQLTDVSDWYDCVALQGPLALVVLNAVFGAAGKGETFDKLPPQSVRALERGAPMGSLAVARSLTGDPGFILLFPVGDGAETIAKLQGEAKQRGLVLPEGAARDGVLELLRVEAGGVRMGVDAEPGARVLPETGLERQVVSYSKGCYLGQEVIARIRTYGSVPLALRGLVIELAKKDASEAEKLQALDEIPAPGEGLLLEEGRKVGEWASRTYAPSLEAPVAYAYLGRDHRTPGLKLKLRGKSGPLAARVVLLPFYGASDAKERARFLHDRAIRTFAEHRDEEAARLLEEALRLDPSFADAYESLGVILGRASRFHEAIDIFKRLEEVAPNEPMVHTNLSLFYMKLGDKEKAEDEKAKATVKQFGAILERNEIDARLAEERAKRVEDARRKRAMFEEVLEIDAVDPVALFGLGNALSTLEEWGAAAETYAKAQAAQPDNSAVYLARGKALEMLERNAEALAVYEAGVAMASKKGDLMPLREMENRALLLKTGKTSG